MTWGGFVGRRPEMAAIAQALSDSGRSVLVRGDIGIGKSALLRNVLSTVRDAVPAVELVTAGLGDRRVRFSATAGLLAPVVGRERLTPGGSTDDPMPLVHVLVAELRLRHPNGMLLCADDVDLLDDASALLVAQLAVSSRVDVVATVRSGQRMHPALRTLFNEPGTLEVVLGRLSDEEVQALAERVLGGQVEASLRVELSRCAKGNPLLVTRALEQGQETGAVTRQGDVWRCAAPLEVALEVASVIRGDPLTDEEMAAGELVALAEPVELAIAERLADGAALAGLECRGIAHVDQEGLRVVMRMDDLACAKALRASTPRTRRRQLARSLAGELARLGARRFDDPVRQAEWLSEAADYAHPEVFVTAAERALAVADADSAMRFARTAASHVSAAEPRILLGQALALLGRVEEAEEHLATAAGMQLDVEQQVRVALSRARNLYWGAGDVERAEVVLAAAAAVVPAGDLRDHLTAVRAGILLFGERYDEALELCDPILDRADVNRDLFVFALPIAHVVWLIRGQVERVLSTATKWLPTAVALKDTAWLTDLRMHSMLIHARAWMGGAGPALSEARQLQQKAGTLGRAGVGGFWNHHVAWVGFLYAGEIGACRDAVDESLQVTESADVFFHRAVTHALLAKAEALLGDHDRADAEMHAADQEYDPRAQTFGTTIEYCRAWVTMLRGDEAGALRLARQALQRCRDVGDRLREATVLDAVARWGYPQDAAPRLSELAGACDSPVIRQMGRAADAARRGEPQLLLAAARNLKRSGWLLHAADHAATAAVLFQGRRLIERSAEAMAFALPLYQQAGANQTPASISMARHEPRLRLSPREWEVAGLAASGLSNDEIAAMLYVEARTVGNHVSSATRKLDLRGPDHRERLTRLFTLLRQHEDRGGS